MELTNSEGPDKTTQNAASHRDLELIAMLRTVLEMVDNINL